MVGRGPGTNAKRRRAVAFLHANTGSEAGLIVLNRAGGVGYARNSAHMPIAYMRTDMAAPVSGG